MRTRCTALLTAGIWLGATVLWAEGLTVGLNHDWRFHRGDLAGAERPDYDDRDWRRLDVPHDWSIEDLGPGQGPLDPNAVGRWDTGYFVGGVGWYRKHLAVDPQWRGRRLWVSFDGVYRHARVWLNGRLLCEHAYGYSPFKVDLTDAVRWDGPNVLAVQVRNEGVNSRWYSGSGIFRGVTLDVRGPLHIDPWGPSAVTEFLDEQTARVRVCTDLVDERLDRRPVALIHRLLGPDGGVAAEARVPVAPAGRQAWAEAMLEVSQPRPWSADEPVLYRLEQRIVEGDRVLDERLFRVGLRTIACDAREGLRINGQPVLLRGMCLHHDHYLLGAAAYPSAEHRRVRLIKQAGYNAVRCAHNPPSAAFLDACDELGLWVIDEAFDQWTRPKKPQDYHADFPAWWRHDLDAMVLRDRRHPSVIMWSLGNEIPEQRTPEGADWAGRLARRVRQLDDSRLVTIGANMAGPEGDALFAHLDVAGTNYQLDHYQADHERVPERVMMATESFVAQAFEYWQPVAWEPHVIGDFVWTGWDYLGEASIGWWGYRPGWKGVGPYPWHLAYCGEIDALGQPRPAAITRQILWRTGPHRVAAFVRDPQPELPAPEPNNILYWVHPNRVASWTWPGLEGRPLEVVTSCATEAVELRLNGRSLGRRPVSADDRLQLHWQVPYEPGILEAVAWQGERQVDRWTLRTAGPAAALRLHVDRETLSARAQDLAYVLIEVVDAAGTRLPRDRRPIDVTVTGPAVLAGIGNGCPYGTESFQRSPRTAFQGRCLAVVKASGPGTAVVRVRAPEVPEATVTLRCSG